MLSAPTLIQLPASVPGKAVVTACLGPNIHMGDLKESPTPGFDLAQPHHYSHLGSTPADKRPLSLSPPPPSLSLPASLHL